MAQYWMFCLADPRSQFIVYLPISTAYMTIRKLIVNTSIGYFLPHHGLITYPQQRHHSSNSIEFYLRIDFFLLRSIDKNSNDTFSQILKTWSHCDIICQTKKNNMCIYFIRSELLWFWKMTTKIFGRVF